MTGGFSWESILQYVSSYNPLDSVVDSACAGFASTGFAFLALLSGHSTAKYGYLGYLVLFIQKQGKLSLRTSVIFANFQKGSGALFGVFLVYIAKFRTGLARMTLYTYATFISGSQLLWVSRPSKGSYRRLFLVAQLSMLGAGYAGEGSTIYLFKTLLTKTKTKRPKRTRGTDRASITICVRTSGTMTRPGCTCYHDDDRLVGCIGPAATARESCVCFFSGEQYNWKPHVCPILKEGAQEGLCTCCYSESSCPERDNRGNSSVNDQEQIPVENSPQDTEEEMDCASRQPQRENARKRRNRIRKKLFAAKLPATILGTVLAAMFSTEIFIKISTVVSMISYNLFFWMGAQCYDLGEMEYDDTTDENESGQMENDGTTDENESGQMENDGTNAEGNNGGKDKKRNWDALVRDSKKAAEAVRKLFPLWLTFASTCYLVNAIVDSLFMEQVDYLENNTQCQSSKIPKPFFYSFPDIVSHITGQVSFYLFEQFLVQKKEQSHDKKKEQSHDKKTEQLDDGGRWARLLRISIGMLFSSLCCIVASLVAYSRLDSNYNSASMLWLLPQFLLWGMMKGILEEGLEEFLHDHIKNDLVVQAVSGIAESVGSWINMILTAASPSSWVGSGNDISKSHLDKYYRMLAIITLFSTFLFTIVAIAYESRPRPKEKTEKSGKKG